MKWKNRLTNYNFWISLASAVLLIFQAFDINFDLAYANEIITAVLGVFVVVGIISDPTKSTTSSDGINSTEESDTENELDECETNAETPSSVQGLQILAYENSDTQEAEEVSETDDMTATLEEKAENLTNSDSDMNDNSKSETNAETSIPIGEEDETDNDIVSSNFEVSITEETGAVADVGNLTDAQIDLSAEDNEDENTNAGEITNANSFNIVN